MRGHDAQTGGGEHDAGVADQVGDEEEDILIHPARSASVFSATRDTLLSLRMGHACHHTRSEVR